MALFIDREVPVEPNSIQLEMAWHSRKPLLAVGTYSEEKGGYVRIIEAPTTSGGLGGGTTGVHIDENGIPPHPTAQVSSLAWHTGVQSWLAVGWENGELYLYHHSSDPDLKKCLKVDSLHGAAVFLMQWSPAGSRLVTADKNGSVVGWRIDPASGQPSVIFHHELKDELRGLVFCSPSGSESGGIDISNLAKAAVAGDEKALDLFSMWNNGQMATIKPGATGSASENLNCYAGSTTGVIYFLNANGSCMEVLQADGAVKYILHYNNDSQDIIIVITESMVIGQFQVDPDGCLTEVAKIKVSTRTKENQAAWAGKGMLAIATGEVNVRLWDLKTDDNYVLPNPPASSSSTSLETITSLAFCEDRNILAAGTNAGYVLMWRYPAHQTTRPSDEDWKALPRVHIGPTIRSIAWGGMYRYLAINSVRQVFMLTEQDLACGYCDGVSALQVAPSEVQVKFHEKSDSDRSESVTSLRLQMQVSYLKLCKGYLYLMGNGRMVTYEIQKDISHLMSVGDFQMSDQADVVTAFETSIFTLEKDRVYVRSFQGTIKHTLHLADSDGPGVTLDVTGPYVVCSTRNGVVRVWDVSKRDARQHSHPIMLREKIPDFGHVLSLRVSNNATHVSVVARQMDGSVDPKLYIFNMDRDIVRYFNFASGRNESDDVQVPPNSAQSQLRTSPRSDSNAKAVSNRYVVNHLWDSVETNFLVCYTKACAPVMTEKNVEVTDGKVFFFIFVFLIGS